MTLSPSHRKQWSLEEIATIYQQPFNDLLWQAHSIHRQHFNPNEIQASTLLSIKTGGCPEDCKYCPQSAHYKTNVEKERLLAIETILTKAEQAKAQGSTRFCMGAAWRNPTDRDMPHLLQTVAAVKAMGLETCMTLGKLTPTQAVDLANAGLDYYNHNLDTSPEYYNKVITTRTFEDRLTTLEYVREAGMKVCCGGILGMGESHDDRLSLLQVLANLEEPPESVPINLLIKVKGTPFESIESIDPLDFIRAIATARILMPTSYVRLSAGREKMSEALHALAFFAGANSIFYGEKLLTTDNPEMSKDQQLLQKLGIKTQNLSAKKRCDSLISATIDS